MYQKKDLALLGMGIEAWDYKKRELATKNGR